MYTNRFSLAIISNLKSGLLLFAIALLFSTSTYSQDKKAKALLDAVTAKIKSYDNIVIDFKYSLNNFKENINQESKGNVTMKGNKYVLNLMGVTKIFDGKNNYTINPEDEEVAISKLNEKDENAITPSKLLTFFNSGYKYTWDITQNVKGRKIQYIKLTPSNNKDQRKEIILGIRPEHIYIEKNAPDNFEINVKSELAEYIGHEQIITFDFSGQQLLGKFSSTIDININKEFRLYIDVNQISVFDALTEERM